MNRRIQRLLTGIRGVPCCRVTHSASIVLAVLCIDGCARRLFPPANLAEPGWTSREEQVVWCPRSGAAELTAELLVASYSDGRRFVQLSKQAFPLVTAQILGNDWSIAAGGHVRASGHLPAPSQVAWFQFQSLPPTNAGKGWRLENKSNGIWRVTNLRSGEFIEGGGP